MSDDAKPGSGTRLAELSDEQVVSLAALLDQVRDTPDGDMLRRSVLERMRPQLRVARPPRPLTLDRLFCLPFEDLLHDEAPGARPGMIARAAIVPAWRLVRQNGDAEALEALRRAAGPRTMRDRAAVAELGSRLWPMAARAIAAHRAGNGREDAALAAEVAEIGAIMELADRAEEVRSLLAPKLVPAVAEETAAALSKLFAAVAAEPPDRLLRLARLAMARVAEPVELLSLLPAGTAEIMREQIVADMERHVAAVTGAGRQAGPPPDPGLVAETAETIVQRIRRLGALGQKADDDPVLRRLVGRVATAVKSRVVDGSEEAILAAIRSDAGKAGPGDAPVVDMAAAAEAEDRAWSLKRCERIAGAMGMAADIGGAVKQAAASAERTAEQLVATLKAARPAAAGSPAARPDEAGETAFYRAVRLLEILVGPDRADTLRLRGEAAMKAAIAATVPGESPQRS